MSDQFLTKSVVERRGLLEVGNQVAVESHTALTNFLRTKGEEEAAMLFAEPVFSRGNDAAPPTISWYAPASADEKQPLASLSAEQRAAAEARLRDGLNGAAAHLSDSAFGPLLGAALHIRSAEDIWVVDGRPVITNWGVVDPGVLSTRVQRDQHFRNTLGAYLPFDAAPAISSDEQQARMMNMDGTSGDSAVHRTASTTAMPTPDTTLPSEGRQADVDAGSPHDPHSRAETSRWLYAPLAVLLGVLLVVLIWLLLPGTRLFPPEPAARFIADDRGIAITDEVNRSLEEQIARLEDALANAQCTATGELLLPNGRRPDGLLPESRIADGDLPPSTPTAVPDSVVPPLPQQIAVLPAGPGGDGAAVQSDATLLDLIEAQTVLVIGVGSGISTGTGFFVGPDLVVTNHHVVADAVGANGGVFVTNEALARAHPAQVMSTLGPLEEVGADFALIRVNGVQQSYYTLRSSTETMRLQNVIAAGYPTAILETDSNYRRLLEGDAASIPALAVTDGIVNTEQDLGPPPARVLIHTARISPGSSGGPLVDYCGRVVGVNTFGRTADSRFLNFSLASSDLLRFLTSTGVAIAPASSDAVCTPVATVRVDDGSAAEVESVEDAEAETTESEGASE